MCHLLPAVRAAQQVVQDAAAHAGSCLCAVTLCVWLVCAFVRCSFLLVALSVHELLCFAAVCHRRGCAAGAEQAVSVLLDHRAGQGQFCSSCVICRFVLCRWWLRKGRLCCCSLAVECASWSAFKSARRTRARRPFPSTKSVSSSVLCEELIGCVCRRVCREERGCEELRGGDVLGSGACVFDVISVFSASFSTPSQIAC